ncbi:uncharacterized protein SPSK_06479 [Sporothrix schenckii 1099-18]|uniref:Uncharacterized protein n=1 Tax=Sporothrix schenckii 1099-18 TaxID=1397361 RepID=A0A0F2MIW8_SPOSC|nr:uncharacterized protein SPSK_06479 [Sporothrix schenckii 1099-18]KJR89562.1 hypothetical protein SPSK_06479 [Sporothrix schenckii 1099-18]
MSFSLPASTTASTTTALATGTATSLLSLTTPFVAPPDCDSLFSTTSIVSSFWWNNYTVTTIGITVSDPTNLRFADCQPAGWDAVVPESRFFFSPAVCPSGWTAYNVAAFTETQRSTSTTVTYASYSTVNTAYCCASDYRLNDMPFTVILANVASNMCVQQMGVTIETLKDQYSFSAPASVRVHNPYHIAWNAADRRTLSPTPPDILTCSAVLVTWVPGASVPPLVCSDGEHSDPGRSAGLKVLFIGVPIILVGAALVCCSLCVHYSSKNRQEERARRERVAETAAVENN